MQCHVRSRARGCGLGVMRGAGVLGLFGCMCNEYRDGNGSLAEMERMR